MKQSVKIAMVLVCLIVMDGCNLFGGGWITYVVETINGQPVSSVHLYGDTPVEILLTAFPPEADYAGAVRLREKGWVAIDVTWINRQPDRFQIRTEGILGSVEAMLFTQLVRTSTDLGGIIQAVDPTADIAGVEFTAVAKR